MDLNTLQTAGTYTCAGSDLNIPNNGFPGTVVITVQALSVSTLVRQKFTETSTAAQYERLIISDSASTNIGSWTLTSAGSRLNFSTSADSANPHLSRWPAFSEVTAKPSTVAGYGITDAVSTSGAVIVGQFKMAYGQPINLYKSSTGYSSINFYSQITDSTPAVINTLSTNGTQLTISNGLIVTGGITGALTGNASTASKWATARTLTYTGDSTGTGSIDGSGNVSIALTLANTGVTAGTYKSVTVDSKGRITAGTNPTTLSGYGITDAAASSHVGSTGTAHGTASTSVAGFMSAADKTKLDGIATGANLYVHPTSGATAGTYKSVTVDANGHITAGTNPTTLAGYGITDALGISANAVSASKWATARTLSLTGAATGSVAVDGSANASITVTVPPTGHVHALSTISDSPYKEAADVATTAALTVTATTTTLTNSGTLAALVLDGVTCTAGMRVLVKDQAATAQNGLYTVTNIGSASVAWVLTRSADADTAAEIAGAVVTVDQGTANGAGFFTNDFKKTSTLGTTGMLWRAVIDVGNISSLHHASGATAGTYRSVTVNAQGHITAGTNPTTLAGYGITDALPLTGGTLTGSVLTQFAATGSGAQIYQTGIGASGTASNTRAMREHTGIGWIYERVYSNKIGYGTTGTSDNIILEASTGNITTVGRIIAVGDANDYNSGALELKGNGSTNTIFPTLGFHQPNMFAGSIQMRNGNDFYLYKQGAAVRANLYMGYLNSDNKVLANNLGITGAYGSEIGGFQQTGTGTDTRLWGTGHLFATAPGGKVVALCSNAYYNASSGGWLKYDNSLASRALQIGNGTLELLVSNAGETTANPRSYDIWHEGNFDPATKLNLTGGTLTGNLVAPNFHGSLVATPNTIITAGAGDNATATATNLNINSWYGVGFGPTISGQTIPAGENAVYINVRNGALTARGTVTAPTFAGALSGNASTASKWATARTLTFTGGSTGTGSIDGSGNVSIAMTVPPTGHVHALSTISDSPYKEAADVATTAALTVTATTTTLTNSGTLAALVLDGVTCTAGMRVLVKDQATTAQNGLYTVTNIGSASVAWVLTRSADADTAAEIAGAVVTVDQGTTNGAGFFTNDFKKTSTLGTTGMLWRAVIDVGNISSLHHTSGVTAGTYRSVTVNAQGHITAGTNPTTLAGYGITDAAASSHVGSTGTAHGVVTTSVAGFMSAADKTKLDGIATGANAYTHPASGVTAGTYKSVTVDANGHITAGTNPTTLAGYGITDAAASSHVGSTGTAHGVVTTSVAGFMSAADKTKLDGIATGANNYAHPTGDGNLHIPATGTTNSGKALVAGSTAGSMAWTTLTAAHISDLNSQDAAATASTLVLRDSSADINCRLVRSNYADSTTISGAIAYRVNNSTDNYVRYCSDKAAIRTYLGAQASDATLTALAGLTTAADKMPYFSAADTGATCTLTSFARTLLDDTDAASARSTLGAMYLYWSGSVGSGTGITVSGAGIYTCVFQAVTGSVVYTSVMYWDGTNTTYHGTVDGSAGSNGLVPRIDGAGKIYNPANPSAFNLIRVYKSV